MQGGSKEYNVILTHELIFQAGAKASKAGSFLLDINTYIMGHSPTIFFKRLYYYIASVILFGTFK